jgi:benzoyl-CoA reductase/2-hydroxyglutaryl-CoA dehydratase subunit BcrC/BadD/HgdB
MKTAKKIEEMIENVEKKVHAGEWLRIEQVRMLLNQFGVWMIEQHKRDLRQIKHDILFRGEEEE